LPEQQAKRLPSDIESLLAVAIRDAVWFKPQVQVFLKESGVPPAILREVQQMYKQGKHTIPVVQHVLSQLERHCLAVRRNLPAFGKARLGL